MPSWRKVTLNDLGPELGIDLTVPHFDVTDQRHGGGAKGDGVADDTIPIQAALTAAGSGTVFFPPGTYKTTASLTPSNGTRIFGVGYWDRSSGPAPATFIKNNLGVPVFNATTLNNVTFEGLGIQGSGTTGSKGISIATANGCVIRDCFFDTFADHAIQIVAGGDCTLDNVFAQNALLTRTGRGAYIGAIDVGGADQYLHNLVATCSFSSGTGQKVDGWCSGIVLRSPNSAMIGCIGHLSEVGIVVAASNSRVLGCRADLNQANGFAVPGNESSFVGNVAYHNSRNADNTAAGFLVSNALNTFVGNVIIEDTGAVRMSNGFDDTTSFGPFADGGNMYIGNHSRNLRGTLYNATGSTPATFVSPARSGTSTQTPGAVATVNIAHGLGVTPSNFFVQASETNSRGAPSLYVTADSTNVILNFSANLTPATSYTWRWRAEL